MKTIKKFAPSLFVVIVSIVFIGQTQVNADRDAKNARERQHSECITIQSNWDVLNEIVHPQVTDPLPLPTPNPFTEEEITFLIEQSDARANAREQAREEVLGPRPECQR